MTLHSDHRIEHHRACQLSLSTIGLVDNNDCPSSRATALLRPSHAICLSFTTLDDRIGLKLLWKCHVASAATQW